MVWGNNMICTKCKIDKESTSFLKNKNNPLRGGLQSWCRDCSSQNLRERKGNPPIKGGSKECSSCRLEKDISFFYSDKNTKDGLKRECKECSTRKIDNTHYKQKYNISIDKYEEMSLKRDHKCDICETNIPGNRIKRLCVDHCHTTGNIRGLLCEGCNLGLGKFKDSPDLLRRAAEYLEDKKEVI